MKKRDVGILRGNDRQKFAVRFEKIAQNVRRSGRQNQIGPGFREVAPFWVFINVLNLKNVRLKGFKRLPATPSNFRRRLRVSEFLPKPTVFQVVFGRFGEVKAVNRRHGGGSFEGIGEKGGLGRLEILEN